MKRRIFIGMENIASQIPDYKKGFEEIGHEVFTAVHGFNHPGQSKEGIDFDLSKKVNIWKHYRFIRPRCLQLFLKQKFNIQKNRLFRKVAKNCDTIIYLGSTIYDDCSDIKKFKNLGKTVLVIFMGSDIRWYHAMKQEFDMFGLPPAEYNPNWYSTDQNLIKHLNYLRLSEKYADYIVSMPNQSQLSIRPYFSYRSILNLSMFSLSNEKQRIRPLIVHSPSSRDFKGTKYILKAIDNLKESGFNFDFELIENLEYEKAIQKYRNCDILISQVLCPSGGKLAYEGLSLGKVVLSIMGMDLGYDEKNPRSTPIVDVNIYTLEKKLKQLIVNRELRQRIALKGPSFVSEYNSKEFICSRILDILDGKIEPEIYPTFFSEFFEPELPSRLSIYNSYTEMVKDCNWYKKLKFEEERSGLKF